MHIDFSSFDMNRIQWLKNLAIKVKNLFSLQWVSGTYPFSNVISKNNPENKLFLKLLLEESLFVA